jgi:hypothetical protein
MRTSDMTWAYLDDRASVVTVDSLRTAKDKNYDSDEFDIKDS